MANNTVEIEIDFQINDSPQSVLAFLRRLHTIFDPSTAVWRLDLTRCNYLGPDAATIVVASVLDARSRNVDATVSLPSEPAPLKAFSEFSGLEHYLGSAPYPSGDHPESVIVPIKVQRDANFNDPDRIIGLIRRFVSISSNLEDYLRICINEVIQNVEDHADSTIGCVSSARFMRNIGEVRVAIVDRGRGICTTLRERYPFMKNAAEALEHVLQGGYSAKSRPNNMGVGISNLSKIVVEQLHGELFMISENAFVDEKYAKKRWLKTMDVNFPGTGVFFTIPVSEE